MYLDELIKHDKINEIPLVSRKSKRAKRILIKLNPTCRSVELVYPTYMNHAQAQAFLIAQKEWLIHHISELNDTIILANQSEVTLFGVPYALNIETKKARNNISHINNDSLIIYGDTKERVSVSLRIVIQNHAKETFNKMASHYAAQIGEVVSKVSVKDMKTRWGSCSIDKSISISWRLAFAPEEVAYYVMAHEVAHMKHMNHSKKFWLLVEQLYPNYKKSKSWLSKYGHTLHAYV